MSAQSQYRGRIAPTPSGLLHVGHAATFKTACARAKKRGGKIVLRIEDIDRPRCKREYIEAAVEDLKSVGIEWDEGFGVGGEYAPYLQSERFDYYWTLVERLSELGLIYPCEASRAQIKISGKYPARTFDFCESEIIFPDSLRGESRRVCDTPNAREKNWRFIVPRGTKIKFFDNNFGEMEFIAGEDFGDFLVWRKSSEPS